MEMNAFVVIAKTKISQWIAREILLLPTFLCFLSLSLSVRSHGYYAIQRYSCVCNSLLT